MVSVEEQFCRFLDAGDGAALGAVFDALAPELLLVAAHLASAGVEAEDLVQATFLDAIERAARWDRRRPLMPWLVGILVNHVRRERQRMGRTVQAQRLPTRTVVEPLDLVAGEEVVQQVAEAVRSLPRRYRQVLTLRLLHGLTPTQIAHALDCPLATAKTRLQRGMEWLRRVLPAGIAASAVGLLSAGRGLAQVRRVLLARAGAGAGIAGGVVAVATAVGGLAVKKLVAACCVLGAAAFCAMLAMSEFSGPAPSRTETADPQGQMISEPGEGVGKQEGHPSSHEPQERRTLPAARPGRGSALLEFVWKHDGSPAANLRVGARPNGSTGSITGWAGRDGRLRIDGLPPGPCQLVGRHLWHRIEIEAGVETRERIEVEATLRLRGVVVDKDGRRVAAARVHAQYFPNPEERHPRWIATTDEQGMFRCGADQGGWVWAQKPGHAPSPGVQTTDEGETELDLELVLGDSAGRLQGVVLEADGRPAAGAQLTIVNRTNPHLCSAPVVLRCDAEGGFSTTELAAGEHVLVARADRHALTPLSFSVTPGSDQVVRVQLLRGATLFGSLADRDERPVPAVVEVRPAWAGGGDAWVESLRPLYLSCTKHVAGSKHGSYRMEHVPVGELALEVQPGNDGSVGQKRRLVAADGVEHRCDFVLGAGGEIHGRLLDDRDRPVQGWFVTAEPNGGGLCRDQETDAAGRFRLKGLAAPDYSVTVHRGLGEPGLPWASEPRVQPGAGELVLRVASDGGWFRGRVLDANGRAVQRAELLLSLLSPAAGGRVWAQPLRLDEDGGFEYGPVVPAAYSVRVNVPDEGRIHLGRREPGPGERLDLGSVSVPARGTVVLRFTGAGGRTFEVLELRVWDRAGNQDGAFARLDDGSWRSKPLPAGVYWLRAWGKDFAQVAREIVVVGGRVTPLEVSVQPATSVCLGLRGPTRQVETIHLLVKDDAGKILASQMLPPGVQGSWPWTRGFLPGRYSFVAGSRPGNQTVAGSFRVRGADRQDVVVKLPGKE